MKLSIKAVDLLQALRQVRGAVQRRNTIPILANAKLEADGTRLSIKGTDLDMEITASVSAAVEATGSITVPLETLLNFVGKLEKDGTIRLEIDDKKNVLKVTAGRSRATLNTLPSNDFPDNPIGDTNHRFDLTEDMVARLFGRPQFAISTEETRYYLNGVYMHVADQRLLGVATDGHRLCKVGIVIPEGAAGMPGVIVPRKTVAELLKLADGAGTIEVMLSASRIQFRCGDVVMVSKLIDGTFPDYGRVIPSANDKMATVKREDLADAAERVATVSSERGRAVRLHFEGANINLSVTNADTGSATEDVDGTYSGDPITIGFNSRYLADVLAGLEGDEIKIEMADPGAPALLRTDEDPDFVAVLMPMRV